MTTAVNIDNVSIVFGERPGAALPLMDEGLDRATESRSAPARSSASTIAACRCPRARSSC